MVNIACPSCFASDKLLCAMYLTFHALRLPKVNDPTTAHHIISTMESTQKLGLGIALVGRPACIYI